MTEKIERELRQIEEIAKIRSSSRNNSSVIVVGLKARVKNIDEVWSQVRDLLADVATQLPPGASAPRYDELVSKAYTLITALTWDLPTPPNGCN